MPPRAKSKWEMVVLPSQLGVSYGQIPTLSAATPLVLSGHLVTQTLGTHMRIRTLFPILAVVSSLVLSIQAQDGRQEAAAQSALAQTTLNPGADRAPAIHSQPASQTVDYAAGATFSVQASGRHWLAGPPALTGDEPSRARFVLSRLDNMLENIDRRWDPRSSTRTCWSWPMKRGRPYVGGSLSTASL